MLSSEDEACKLEFRSERIPYYSVHRQSFFPSNSRKRAGKIKAFLGRLLFTFHKKSCFFFLPSEKNLAHVNIVATA